MRKRHPKLVVVKAEIVKHGCGIRTRSMTRLPIATVVQSPILKAICVEKVGCIVVVATEEDDEEVFIIGMDLTILDCIYFYLQFLLLYFLLLVFSYY